jgi:hypothetical protein
MTTLPVLPTVIDDSYAFPVTVPSSGAKISMRPYLVKEEKLLLMAQESESYEDQADAVAQIIRNCTYGAVEPKIAPFFDVEYLLLQLRSRSIGAIASPVYECHNKITHTGMGIGLDVAIECKNKTPIEINLSEIPVTGLDNQVMDVVISPKFTLTLRYPTIFTVNEMFIAAINAKVPKQSKVIDSLSDLFDTLVDTTSNTVYNFADYSHADKIAFMDSLPPNAYERITEFLEKTPTVTKTLEYTCSKCQFHHVIKLSGLVDFLVWE